MQVVNRCRCWAPGRSRGRSRGHERAADRRDRGAIRRDRPFAARRRLLRAATRPPRPRTALIVNCPGRTSVRGRRRAIDAATCSRVRPPLSSLVGPAASQLGSRPTVAQPPSSRWMIERSCSPHGARASRDGQGAVSPEVYLAQLPALVDHINAGTIALKANPKPLADVEKIWVGPDRPGERTVLVP